MEEKQIMEQVEELRKRVNRPDLVMSRVPKKELEWFREWCKEEFENDYGMAFKNLVDIFHEYYEMKDTYTKLIDLLSAKEKTLQSQSNQPEEKVIKMGSGRLLKIGEEKNG